MGRMARRVVVALLVALISGLLWTLGACTADDSRPPGHDDAGQDVALQVESLRTAGIDEGARSELESEVGDLLADYIVGGFLGDYPREDFVRGLASFSNGLADDGGRDLAILTLSGSQDIRSVRATRLHARLSYYNPRGEVVGATAFIDLAFEVTRADGSTVPATRTGKLVLGRAGGDWQVIGYHVVGDDGSEVQAETES
jgi:hypothetical protein